MRVSTELDKIIQVVYFNPDKTRYFLEKIYDFLSDDDLLRITNKIKDMEALSSGEIRVSVKEKKPLFKKKKDISELAKEEFFKLKMNNTRDKTGILIFLLLDERQFYILADSGINEKVPPHTWDHIRDEVQAKFRTGKFSEGIILCVEEVGQKLSEHFPRKSDDTNELSNRVTF